MTPDRVVVHPGPLSGEVRVPGDKSQSHRALILGGLVGEPVRVSGLAPSGDVRSTAGCLAALGATVDLSPDDDGNLGGAVTGPLREPDDVLDCGNSGTGMRLLAGVVAGIDGVSVLTGDTSLRGRPMGRIVAPLRSLGASVDGREDGSRPPLVVRGGGLHDGEWNSPVASAQVKSSLLLAGLTADVAVTVRSPRASRDHTEQMVSHLGGRVETVTGPDGEEIVSVAPGGALQARDLRVSGDPSSAAFWLAAAACAGTEVRLPGVLVGPRRDGMLRVLAQFGAAVDGRDVRDVGGERVADVCLAAATLGGRAEVAGALVVDAIDELPVLAVVAACSAGGMVVRDAAELRVKESDRIDGIARLLAALGLDVEVASDGFTVPGGQAVRGGGTVDAHGDHRIAMAASVGATVAADPVTITGFRSVPTSYPNFLDHLEALGGRYEVLA